MLNLWESFNGFSDGDEIGIEKGEASDRSTVHYIAYVPHYSSDTKNTNHSSLLFVLFIFFFCFVGVRTCFQLAGIS